MGQGRGFVHSIVVMRCDYPDSTSIHRVESQGRGIDRHIGVVARYIDHHVPSDWRRPQRYAVEAISALADVEAHLADYHLRSVTILHCHCHIRNCHHRVIGTGDCMGQGRGFVHSIGVMYSLYHRDLLYPIPGDGGEGKS